MIPSLLIACAIASPAPGQEELLVPSPTGRHAVGTSSYAFADERRSAPNGGPRTIIAQFWYPAIPENEMKTTPVRFEAFTRGRTGEPTTEKFALRTFGLNEGAIITTESRLPILLCIPDYGMSRRAYTGIAEDLASHGYVVVAIDMPEISSYTALDGSTMAPNAAWLPPAQMTNVKELDSFYREATQVGTADVLTTLQHIELLNRQDTGERFKNKLETRRVGLIGHGLGSRIAAAVGRDSRVLSIAYIDGTQPPDIRQSPHTKPMASVVGTSASAASKQAFSLILPNVRRPYYYIELDGADSESLTDLSLVRYRSKGTMPGEKSLELGRVILRSFFQESLLKRDAVQRLLRDYPEVKVQLFAPRPNTWDGRGG